MQRLKTFLIYFLIFIGFLIFSVLMEALYIYNSYVSIKNNGIVDNAYGINLDIKKFKATRVNGVITVEAQNNSGEELTNKFIKIDLINKQNLVAATKYVPIEKIDDKQTIEYKVAFKANDIEKYKMSITNEEQIIEPDYINVLGINIDIDNMVVQIKDVSKKMPDWVYNLAGIWAAFKTGTILWSVVFFI